MQIIETAGAPIHCWAPHLEEGAMIQAMNVAELSMLTGHVCIMPDGHQGYGVPIGGVFATQDAVIPNAVGLDIGCSVTAMHFDLHAQAVKAKIPKILAEAQEKIPTGQRWHDKPQENSLFDNVPDIHVLHRELNRAKYQLGTLGGGNHFVEFSRDQNGQLWLMVHTGSRNLGKQVAKEFNEIAETANHFGIPHDRELAALSTYTKLGKDYLLAMNFCLSFAAANHSRIMERLCEIMRDHIGRTPPALRLIYTRHNYAEMDPQGCVVHRKGAVHAKGLVAIPGSMGTRSYIGRGLENPEAFESCSHGAGRKLSRAKAKKTWSSEDIVNEMFEKGIHFYKAGKKSAAEEASGAYKDIDEIMAAQADLVEPVYTLQPMGVLKG